jgi:hypothetical protein
MAVAVGIVVAVAGTGVLLGTTVTVNGRTVSVYGKVVSVNTITGRGVAVLLGSGEGGGMRVA